MAKSNSSLEFISTVAKIMYIYYFPGYQNKYASIHNTD